MKEHPVADTILRDIAIVIGIAVIIYISNNITPLNVDTVASGQAPDALKIFLLSKVNFVWLQNFLFTLKTPLVILGLFFLGAAFWATLRARSIHHHEHEKYKPIVTKETVASEKTIQWQVILDHVNGDNPAEWKMAILEADNILDEVLEDQGYIGETVAEKLKTMSPTRIASYNDLWDAHKLRNDIAHGGSIDMDLTQKMARDAIAKFENAFRELGYL